MNGGTCPSCRRSVDGTGATVNGAAPTKSLLVESQSALFVPVLVGALFAIGGVVDFNDGRFTFDQERQGERAGQ
jgi:hypothetical protein